MKLHLFDLDACFKNCNAGPQEPIRVSGLLKCCDTSPKLKALSTLLSFRKLLFVHFSR